MTAINIKKYLCLIVFSIFYQLTFSQDIEFKKVNFKSDKKGLRSAKESIEIADQFRKKAILNFLNNQDAISESENAFFYYQKAQLFNSNNADLNYKIGSVLLLTNKKELAKEYLDRAISFNKKLPDEISFFQAMVLQLQGKYAEALDSYQYFRDNAKKKIVNEYNVLLEKYIEECSIAPDLLDQKKRIWVDNLDINSEYDDWSPCLSTDGELLIFTSNRKNKN